MRIYKIFFIFILFGSVFLYSKELINVSVQLNWKHQFEFAGFYMAKEKGFYKDVGLYVDIKELKQETNIVDDVLKGKSTFGIGYPTLVLDRANGKNIVLLAAILQSSPLVLVSLKSSGINSFKDFKNKRVMMNESASKNAAIISMFLANNVDFNSIKLVENSFNIYDLINKKVDAMSVFVSDEIYTLKRLGLDYKIWDPKDYGFDFYDEILFTSQKELTNHPDIVRNFTIATIKGWKYAFSHISETIDIIQKRYNSQKKSRKALFYEAITLKNLAYYHIKRFGYIDSDKIQRIYDIYNFMGLTKSKIDMDKFIYKLYAEEKGDLTQKEIDYLKRKKTIKLCANPNWRPIEFVDKGEPKGISIDTLDIIFDNLGINYKYVKTNSWSESQKFLKERKCDILPSAIKTASRLKYANFTKPYLKYNLVIVTRDDKPLVQNLESIIDKTMSRKKGSGLIEKLRKKYPHIKIVETKDYKEAFKMVEDGDVYFTIATVPVLSYYKNRYDFSHLQIAGYTKGKYNLCIAVRKDDPVLLDILDKELIKIPKGMQKIIFDKWTNKKYITKNNYSLIFWIVGVFILIIFIIIVRNIFISRYNKKLEIEIQKAKQEIELKHKQLLQQSRLAQMGEMISMIAHQWRQPLSAISSAASALQLKSKLNRLDKEQAEELSGRIIEYSQHLSSTIDDFRSFFRDNKSKKSITYDEIIKSTLNIVEESMKNKNIKIEKRLDSKIVFKTYVNELKQVVLNLIKNAEDALLDKKIENPRIVIETQGKVLRVRDNAGGVPKEIMDKIFDPYFSTKSKKDGTGLGLYMSKTIIEEHCGGKLRVSNDEQGAVFEIELP